MPKILVIIVTYNALKWIKKGLKSVEKSSLPADVLLIDNGSTDGTLPLVRTETINLGVNALMQFYRDNGISQYRYKSYEEIEQNPFAKNLVIQTLEFYSHMLCKWIKEQEI